MNFDIDLILLIVAAVCFALAAMGAKFGNLNLTALGLLAWVATALLPWAPA